MDMKVLRGREGERSGKEAGELFFRELEVVGQAAGEGVGDSAFPMAALADAGGIVLPRGTHRDRLCELITLRVVKIRGHKSLEQDFDLQNLSITIGASHLFIPLTKMGVPTIQSGILVKGS